jgi:hypothetical protein
MPSRRIGKERRAIAAAAMRAPRAPVAKPLVNEIVLPNLLATQVKRIAPAATPSVANAVGRPLRLVDPSSPPANDEMVSAIMNAVWAIADPTKNVQTSLSRVTSAFGRWETGVKLSFIP